MSDYNGWKNYETWNTNLWFGDDMTGMASDNGKAIDADWCREIVEEYLQNSVGNVFQGFIGDIVQSFLGGVDWQEIAKHVNDDAELSDDANEESDDTDEDDTDDAMDIVEYLLENR